MPGQPGRSSLPSSVVIPSGHSYVVITVTTETVSTTVNATVTASATNYTTGACGVTITP